MGRTTSQGQDFPGWYITFLAAALQQLPRPPELDQMTAETWCKNQGGLKKVFTKALLLPPLEKTGGKLIIDRSKPFDPVAFIGEKGWKIVEQDERALELTEIDLSAVMLKHMLRDGEAYVVGEEKLKRLKEAGHIRLDAGAFKALWDNPVLIPESWKGKAVYFDGTVLVSPNGYRFVPHLYWYGTPWYWHDRYLHGLWYDGSPSAVLAAFSAGK